MYDLWYALGVGIITPKLLVEINKANPKFDFVQRIIIEIADDQIPVLRPKAPNTGLLEDGPTTAVRLAIAGFVQKFSPAAPPIGIYCAGRLCQLIQIPFFSSSQQDRSSFSDIIALAHQAYLIAIGQGPESKLATFPAFLGLCLLDGNLVQDLPHRQDGCITKATPRAIEAAGEFGIGDDAKREWEIVTAFISADEFVQASDLLMVQDKSPWKGTTGEQIFFWQGLTEHAIP